MLALFFFFCRSSCGGNRCQRWADTAIQWREIKMSGGGACTMQAHESRFTASWGVGNGTSPVHHLGRGDGRFRLPVVGFRFLVLWERIPADKTRPAHCRERPSISQPTTAPNIVVPRSGGSIVYGVNRGCTRPARGIHPSESPRDTPLGMQVDIQIVFYGSTK